MWIVQAVDEPPSPIMQTNHGEILISRHKGAEGADRPDVAQPIASAATLALIGGQGPKDEDPWAKHDPWRQLKPSTVKTCPTPAAAESVLQLESRLESKIEASVNAKLPQAMKQDDIPDRLCQWEGQFHQLMQKQNQQNHMDHQFQEFSQLQTRKWAYNL